MVDAVQRVKVVDEEERQRATRGDGTVHLARLGDVDLGLLGQLHLLLGLDGRLLGLLQVLNQLDVLQDVALSGRRMAIGGMGLGPSGRGKQRELDVLQDISLRRGGQGRGEDS